MHPISRRLLAIVLIVLLLALGIAAAVAIGSGRPDSFGPWASVALFAAFLAFLLLSYFLEDKRADRAEKPPAYLVGPRRSRRPVDGTDVASDLRSPRPRSTGRPEVREPDAPTLLIGCAFGALGLGALVAFTGFGIWVAVGVTAAMALVLALDAWATRRSAPGPDAGP